VIGDEQFGESCLIDPSHSVQKITSLLKNKKAKALYILLTHGHLNHAARAQELRILYQTKIYAHKNELPHLQRLFSLGDQAGLCGVKTPIIDKLICQGDTITLGSNQIEVIETPGHTLGSLSFRLGNAFFVGDLCQENGLYLKDSPSNLALQKKSLKQLLKLTSSADIVYPGHGPTFSACRLSDF